MSGEDNVPGQQSTAIHTSPNNFKPIATYGLLVWNRYINNFKPIATYIREPVREPNDLDSKRVAFIEPDREPDDPSPHRLQRRKLRPTNEPSCHNVRTE